MDYLSHHLKAVGKDRLREFVVAATVARRLRQGFVAVVQSSMHRELYLHLLRLRDEVMFCGKVMNLVAGLGALFPINLFDVPQALDWVKEHDPDTHAHLRTLGMTTPATVYDGMLKVGPQVLLANIDVRRPLEDSDVRIARYIIKQHVNIGCPVLLTVNDFDDLGDWVYGALLKGVKEFRIGRF
jgi:hypothetical protein